jgi:hypothetical protein
MPQAGCHELTAPELAHVQGLHYFCVIMPVGHDVFVLHSCGNAIIPGTL